MAMPLTRKWFEAFVTAARMGVVATADTQGYPEAALVDLVVTSTGEVVFNSRWAARKVVNIAACPRVALVVGWEDGVSVQAEGDAAILTGDERERYGRLYLARFPGSRALQEDFALIAVTLHWLRYYDARPESFQVIETRWDQLAGRGVTTGPRPACHRRGPCSPGWPPAATPRYGPSPK